MTFVSDVPRNLVIAYLATWVIHIGYLLLLSSGFRKLGKELRELQSRKEK
jgi:CcmD family protein